MQCRDYLARFVDERQPGAERGGLQHPEGPAAAGREVNCRERLGGLLRYYHRDAA